MQNTNVNIQKETMKSRDRVLKAINHQESDRMPIDLGMYYSSGISAFAYRNLREYLGLSSDNIVIVDPMQLLARVDEDILKRFHCDCILLHQGWPDMYNWSPRRCYNFKIPTSLKPMLNKDGYWIIDHKGLYKMPEEGFFFDGSGWLDAEYRSEDDIINRLAIEAKRIFYETEYFTIYIGFGAFFSSNPDWMCRMLTQPGTILEENQKILNGYINKAGKIIDIMGNYIQGICVNSDLGSQQGPFCRPAVWRELCAPFLEKFCSFIHRNSDLKVFMHCCGSIKPLINDLIDCGIDILNPVQISANNMDPFTIKCEFGDRITFWGGGCNTQEILNNGTPDEVKQNVKKLIKIFKPGGGFVFNQVHNIMGDIKPENIVAMFDTAYECSFY